MTNKEAFVHGIETFCKEAGLDEADTAQMERLLFMPPETAAPIVKAASVSVRRIKYVHTGKRLTKSAANIQQIISNLMATIKDPATWKALSDAAKQQSQTASMQEAGGQPETPATPAPASEGDGGGWWSGVGKAIGSLFGGSSSDADKPAPDAAEEKMYQDFTKEWEGSPLKGSIPLKQYIGLRKMWEGGSQTTPMDTFIGGRWAAKRHQLQQRESRMAMRGLGIDMAPGELASMDDATIKARFTDPAKQMAVMNARDMARTREREQGGVGAVMGGGLSTGNGGGNAAMNAADTTPPPAPAPTSTAPDTSNVPGSQEEARNKYWNDKFKSVDVKGGTMAINSTVPTSTGPTKQKDSSGVA